MNSLKEQIEKPGENFYVKIATKKPEINKMLIDALQIIKTEYPHKNIRFEMSSKLEAVS